MKKIKAYTLMEVTIAMLLSALCIGICYSAYEIIKKYYAAFQQKNENAQLLLSLKQTMSKDMAKSGLVLKTDQGLGCQQDSLLVDYLFEEGQILRKLEGLRTDTFKVAYKELYMGFEGHELESADTLDLLRFKVMMDQKNIVPLIFSKDYSSQNLFH